MTPEVFDAIIAAIASGTAVRKAVSENKVSSQTFYRALSDPECEKRYARAKEAQLDAVADEIIEIADESPDTTEFCDRQGNVIDIRLDSGYVAWQRNRIESRKWLLAKLAPKKYGDDRSLKVEVSHGITGLSPHELLRARDTLRSIIAARDGGEGPGEPALIDVSPIQ